MRFNGADVAAARVFVDSFKFDRKFQTGTALPLLRLYFMFRDSYGNMTRRVRSTQCFPLIICSSCTMVRDAVLTIVIFVILLFDDMN